MKVSRAVSNQNLLFDPSLGYARLVCAQCKVPFAPADKRVESGVDEEGMRIFICRDCQRQVPWDDDHEVDPRLTTNIW
jgi:hypothetical protein